MSAALICSRVVPALAIAGAVLACGTSPALGQTRITLQGLQAQVDALAGQNAAQQAEIDQLESQVAALQAQVADLQSTKLGQADADARYRRLDQTVSWTDLAQIPPGFADGADDGLTSVATGGGLVGNGTPGSPVGLSSSVSISGNLTVQGVATLNRTELFGPLSLARYNSPPSGPTGTLYSSSTNGAIYVLEGFGWRRVVTTSP